MGVGGGGVGWGVGHFSFTLLRALSLGFSLGFLGFRTSWDSLLQIIILPSPARVKKEQQTPVGREEWGLIVPSYSLL